MRQKVVVLIGTILPEEISGVPDSALADFIRFDMEGPPDPQTGRAKPVIGFRFCCWCGKPFVATSETRLTHLDPMPTMSDMEDEDGGPPLGTDLEDEAPPE